MFPYLVIIRCLALTDKADHLHCEEECYIPGHQETISHPTFKWLIYNWHDWLKFYLDTSSAPYELLLVINELPCLYSTQCEIWNLNFENWILKIEFWKLNFENWILNFQNCVLYKQASSKITSNSSNAALKVSR